MQKGAGLAARSPLIRHYGGERPPQEFRAYLRSVSNIGISLGAVMAGWAVQVGSHTSYTLLVAGNAIAFAAAAAVMFLLPKVAPPVPASHGPRWIALRDRPLPRAHRPRRHHGHPVQGAHRRHPPLWLVTRTEAPHWLISGTMLLNTLLVIGFQIRASRNIDNPTAGGWAYRRSGVAFLAACALISLSAGMPGWTAAALLLAAVVVHTIGELWHSAAGFEVSFALAPPARHRPVPRSVRPGRGLAEAVGPALLISLCITWGRPGWYIVGTMFLLAGLAAPPSSSPGHNAIKPDRSISRRPSSKWHELGSRSTSKDRPPQHQSSAMPAG